MLTFSYFGKAKSTEILFIFFLQQELYLSRTWSLHNAYPDLSSLLSTAFLYYPTSHKIWNDAQCPHPTTNLHLLEISKIQEWGGSARLFSHLVHYKYKTRFCWCVTFVNFIWTQPTGLPYYSWEQDNNRSMSYFVRKGIFSKFYFLFNGLALRIFNEQKKIF